MKTYKLILMFSVLAIGLGAIAWIFGFVNPEQALDGSGRIIGAIVVLGVCSAIVWSLLQSKSSTSQNETRPNEPGPKF